MISFKTLENFGSSDIIIIITIIIIIIVIVIIIICSRSITYCNYFLLPLSLLKHGVVVAVVVVVVVVQWLYSVSLLLLFT